jgi:membrane protein DedA with SNARE-associated domain
VSITALAADTGFLDRLADFAVDMMERLGSVGAGLAILLENLFPPLPSEVILPLAGFAASRGDLNLLAAIFWTTTGSVLGALILYFAGALLGHRRVEAIAVRLPLIKGSDVEWTVAWFARHGTKAVFFGRMIPIFRSLISVPAGVERMPLGTFIGLTAAGSLIWNSMFIISGYLLGENWTVVGGLMDTGSTAVLVIVVLLLGLFVVNRAVKGLRERRV